MSDKKLTLTPLGERLLARATSEQASLNSGTETGSTQFSDTQMQRFFERQRSERNAELGRLSNGFVSTSGVQPGPVIRGALGLMRSRFDVNADNDTDRDHIDLALSGGTRSMALNQVVAGVGMDLFGNMLRNVGRISQHNDVIDAFNRSGNTGYRLAPRWDPATVTGAEEARLRVGVNRGTSPHFDQNTTSISLMEPSALDQTAHELQHARDHLHGDLDLHTREHRLASELNAFTRQDLVSRQLTGGPPPNFEGRSPRQMAESYHGKEGYPGTLDSSLESVRRFKGG